MLKEKLLKRFMTPTGKIVLEAIYKWAEVEEAHSIEGSYKPMHMYEQAIEVGNWADRKVLKTVLNKLRDDRHAKQRRSEAEEIAARILMGDRFDGSNERVAAQSNPYANQAQPSLYARGVISTISQAPVYDIRLEQAKQAFNGGVIR